MNYSSFFVMAVLLCAITWSFVQASPAPCDQPGGCPSNGGGCPSGGCPSNGCPSGGCPANGGGGTGLLSGLLGGLGL